MDGFQELVQDIWNKPVASTQPLKRLHVKLSRVAKAIKRWRKEKIGDIMLQLTLVKEILLQLEATQEHRALSQEELQLRRRLKARSVGLVAIEKTRIRQKSCLTNINVVTPTQNSSTFTQAQGLGRTIYNAYIRTMGLCSHMKIKKL